VARGGPPGDGRRQPWWSSSSPSHLSAQHSAAAAKEKFGAAPIREKSLGERMVNGLVVTALHI
jgi:hypothetical protein